MKFQSFRSSPQRTQKTEAILSEFLTTDHTDTGRIKATEAAGSGFLIRYLSVESVVKIQGIGRKKAQKTQKSEGRTPIFSFGVKFRG